MVRGLWLVMKRAHAMSTEACSADEGIQPQPAEARSRIRSGGRRTFAGSSRMLGARRRFRCLSGRGAAAGPNWRAQAAFALGASAFQESCCAQEGDTVRITTPSWSEHKVSQLCDALESRLLTNWQMPNNLAVHCSMQI